MKTKNLENKKIITKKRLISLFLVFLIIKSYNNASYELLNKENKESLNFLEEQNNFINNSNFLNINKKFDSNR